ncbi:C6 finger domain-containing protein [Colletotrichum kahawae]|uniref:C6 finger domain-containing protein n=1 Tax=Colletotrichum kahawae TaxID=34407 RepID=A0AAE0D8G6_COLKA|nr:C6 finger domain-containing protein [Colletotrichum kahawae]
MLARCWTCKRRRKKCDEVKPSCNRCVHANLQCEGNETRLTWGSSHTVASKNGIILKPVRPQSLSRKVAQQRKQLEESAQTKAGSCDSDTTSCEGRQSPFIENSDKLSSQSGKGLPVAVGDKITELLVDNFCKSGYLTLTGRSGDGGLMKSDILPMRKTSPSLCNTFAAYQASVTDEYRHLMPVYLQLGISGYINDLQSPENLYRDEIIATGVLLCSVSISGLYKWTTLLKGLHTVLQQRRLLETATQSPLIGHLIEVIALLDVPHFTLNRNTDSLKIWPAYIAQRHLTGVQETSGLPYSLLDLICNMDSPDTEQRLLNWPGEPCRELVQVHLWEAFRIAAILHCRALRPLIEDKANSAAVGFGDELLEMKALAACQAVIDSRSDSFPGVPHLAAALMYPLFIVCLSTNQDTVARSLSRDLFSDVVRKWGDHEIRLAWDIVIEVWQRSTMQPGVCRLKLAEDFVAELDIEMYLY